MPPSAACLMQPSEVLAGEPVTVSATGSNFNPRHTVIYHWSGSGVKVEGTGATAQINTTGLAPGSYPVTANLSDGHGHTAMCNASFTVRQAAAPIAVAAEVAPAAAPAAAPVPIIPAPAQASQLNQIDFIGPFVNQVTGGNP